MAVDHLRTRHGDITDAPAAQAAEAERNRELAELFVDLRPHLNTP